MSKSNQENNCLPMISGFMVLPVSMPPLTLIEGASLYDHLTESSLTNKKKSQNTNPNLISKFQPIFHHLFLKPHQNSSSQKKNLKVAENQNDELLASGRTLFVINLPVDTTLSHLKRLFRRCGVIEEVYLKGKKHLIPGAVHKSGLTAHIVFKDPESIERAMAMKPRQRVWSAVLDSKEEDQYDMEDDGEMTEDPSELDTLVGMNKWIYLYHHRRADVEKLQEKVDAAMRLFEQTEEEARLEAERRRTEPDEDGFVMVTRGRGRRNVAKDASGATVTAARPEEIKSLAPKKKELKDFYRFQIRESKRDELAELRKKFEEDKAKIAAMKAKNRFKPY